MATIGAGAGAEGWTNTLDKLGLLERVREAIGTSEADGKPDKMSKDAPKQHHQEARSVADNSSPDEGKTDDRDLRNEGFARYQPGETPGQSIIRGDDVTKGGSGKP